jgi:hypothetical protein
LTNDQFNLENIAVYIDRDQNGEPDDKGNLLNASASFRSKLVNLLHWLLLEVSQQMLPPMILQILL